MISGLMPLTHSKVIYGDKYLNQTGTAQLSLGYYSQHNSLWKLLIVKETIQYYLKITGYPRKEIPQYIRELIHDCGIENHANKKNQ